MSYTKLIGLMTGVFLLLGSTVCAQEVYRSHQGGRDLFKRQYGTGQYEQYNCAPTAMAMVQDWLGFEDEVIEEIRSAMTTSTEWVYTDEVEMYMQKKEIPYKKEGLWEETDLITYLEQGILLLCIDLSKISMAKANKLVGRESNSGTGHFIVATGYYREGEETYIEVMDPLNIGVRYYSAQEVFHAASSWWSNVWIYSS